MTQIFTLLFVNDKQSIYIKYNINNNYILYISSYINDSPEDILNLITKYYIRDISSIILSYIYTIDVIPNDINVISKIKDKNIKYSILKHIIDKDKSYKLFILRDNLHHLEKYYIKLYPYKYQMIDFLITDQNITTIVELDRQELYYSLTKLILYKNFSGKEFTYMFKELIDITTNYEISI